jgi:uncharacterized membrane protein
MAQGDWFILLIVGGVFLIIGIILLLWGRYEGKRLLEALASRRDLREFTLGNKANPQPLALKIGGWIAIAVGVILLVVGIIFFFTKSPPV